MAKTKIKNTDYTTITLSRDNKNKIEELKHVYRLNNINDVVSYMLSIFEKHEVKTCQKKKVLKK